MMRRVLKKVLSPALQWWNAYYTSKPRKYSYRDISVVVAPTVFPPFFTLSSKLLLDVVDGLDIRGKSLLELGCGCGIISILAAKKGAMVTASDINLVALASLEDNMRRNGVSINVVTSDLFDNFGERLFDYIIVNPPYYPKNPQSIAEHAWFCGSDFEYFHKFFLQAGPYVRHAQQVLMILSEDCDIDHIRSIARENNIELTILFEKTVASERNFIFALIAQ